MSSRVEIGEAIARAGIVAILRELGDGREPDPALCVDPAATFRLLYDGWVRRGGYERGKPRHSVRQIKAWLGDHPVRSLETKLAGKTRLPYEDASSLLRLFLTRWTYDKVTKSYKPYDCADLDPVARDVLADLFDDETETLLLPDRSRKTSTSPVERSLSMPAESAAVSQTRPTDEAIKDLFTRSDVLVTISRSKTVIGSDPAEAMYDFHYLVEELYELDQKDGRQRTLIWLVDIGLRDDQVLARASIHNLYFLILQFRAIALIRRESRAALYRWLRDHVCIIVGSLEPTEIDRIYHAADITLGSPPDHIAWFQSDRLFLEATPTEWLDVPGSEAYGVKQKELWSNPTITAHLKFDDPLRRSPDDGSPEADSKTIGRLHYLYHREITSGGGEQPADVRCIDLPSPGVRWSDGYRLTIQAALARLNRPLSEPISQVEPMAALAALRSQSFAVLRLDEFMTLANVLVDRQADPSD